CISAQVMVRQLGATLVRPPPASGWPSPADVRPLRSSPRHRLGHSPLGHGPQPHPAESGLRLLALPDAGVWAGSSCRRGRGAAARRASTTGSRSTSTKTAARRREATSAASRWSSAGRPPLSPVLRPARQGGVYPAHRSLG